MKKVISQILFLSYVAFFVGCVSTTTLIDKGFSKIGNGNFDKAESKFTKALEKKTYKDNGVIHKAYHGLSVVAASRQNYVMAENYEFKAHENNTTNLEYAYNLAKFKANKGEMQKAYNWLFYLGDIEANGYGRINVYTQKALNEPMFRTLNDDIKFQRFCQGYRRVKLSILRGYSSESDKWTENDQFATVAANLPSGERKLILCTNVIEDDNSAVWSNQYVVFDYKLGTTLKINQLDEDYTSHDVLSAYTGSIPFDLNLKEIKGNQSRLELNIQDTEQASYTSGTTAPSTIDPTLIGIAIAGAVVYGAGELAYSGIKNMMSSSNSYSSSSYSSSSSTTESRRSKEIPPVTKTGEWSEGIGTLDGQYAYCIITYSDGISGTLFKGKDSGKYYISLGLSNTYFDSYSEAIKGLYLYKTR